MEKPEYPCCVCGVETATEGYVFFMEEHPSLTICELHFHELVKQIDELRKS